MFDILATKWFRSRCAVVATIAISIGLCAGGCGQVPQFGGKDQRLLEAVRTAVSARRPKWLDECAKQIDAEHTQGKISNEGFEALEAIVSQARGGDWSTAEKRIIQLEKGQRPPAK
jgi:hypothetical protein